MVGRGLGYSHDVKSKSPKAPPRLRDLSPPLFKKHMNGKMSV